MCDAEKIEENFPSTSTAKTFSPLISNPSDISIADVDNSNSSTISSMAHSFLLFPKKRVENLLLLFVQTANQSMWK